MTNPPHRPVKRDPLTNSLDQCAIETKLTECLDACGGTGICTLAYLNLGPLKTVNDLYGHAAGDEFLRQICQRIESLLEVRQYLGRFGANEFIILFHDYSVKTAQEVSNRIIGNLRETPCRIENHAFHATAFIGIVAVKRHTEIQRAISIAARICRIAKKKASRHAMVYAPTAQSITEESRRLQLTRQLSGDFSARDLFLQMQPIMSLREPFDALNFEVLLRMHDNAGGLIPAMDIIAAAEQNRTVGAIDQWVLETTLQWLDSHREQLTRTGMVCINISGMSLNDEQFVSDFFATLDNFARLAPMLCIEITESVALRDMRQTRRFIKKLHGIGARIALDDFGVGYTSLSYLAELPADCIKIDGSFIRNMTRRPANTAIVKAIIALARTLGMQSIAESVENVATLENLYKMGVDYVQGFFIGRPGCPAAMLDPHNAVPSIIGAHLRAFAEHAEKRHPAAARRHRG